MRGYRATISTTTTGQKETGRRTNVFTDRPCTRKPSLSIGVERAARPAISSSVRSSRTYLPDSVFALRPHSPLAPCLNVIASCTFLSQPPSCCSFPLCLLSDLRYTFVRGLALNVIIEFPSLRLPLPNQLRRGPGCVFIRCMFIQHWCIPA